MDSIIKKVRPAFTSFEKELIKELITPYINILESKKTNSNFNKEKEHIWCCIAQKFNSSSLCTEATAKQIKKAWLNMKTRARDAKTAEQQRRHTGGGPAIKDMDPEDEAVLSLVPQIMPTVKVLRDSDGLVNDDDNADDDSIYWLPKRARLPSYAGESELLPLPRSSIPEMTLPDSPTHSPPTQINEQTDRPTASSTFYSSSAKKSSKTAAHSLDSLKLKLIENDLKYREIKFNLEIKNLERNYQLSEQILLKELEYKEKVIEMAQAEHDEKLKNLKK